MLDHVLLVHSPLLGSSSCAPLAAALEARTSTVHAPDLSAALDGWETFAQHAAAAAPPSASTALIGHSGAGAFLPAIAGIVGSDRVDALIFVDAVVPPERGVYRTPPEMARLLDDQTVEGTLRPWLDWWPDEIVTDLLPDPRHASALRRDLPRLARSFYDADVPVPAGWAEWRCAYVRLSAAYDGSYEEAGRRGWPRTVVDGHHLSIVTEPGRVLTAVEEVLGGLR